MGTCRFMNTKQRWRNAWIVSSLVYIQPAQLGPKLLHWEMAGFGLQPFSSLTGQERTNIPSYDDMDEFTPAFNVPAAPAKRFETPRNFQQQPYQYQNYAYNYNNQYQDQSKNWLHEKLRLMIMNSRIFKLCGIVLYYFSSCRCLRRCGPKSNDRPGSTISSSTPGVPQLLSTESARTTDVQKERYPIISTGFLLISFTSKLAWWKRPFTLGTCRNEELYTRE